MPTIVPMHIGVIPDGNRRWARKMGGLPITEAYRLVQIRLRISWIGRLTLV